MMATISVLSCARPAGGSPGGVAVQEADPSRAEELLAEYIEQRLAGRGSPTLERLCDRHPELAGELRELVREYEGVRAVVEGPSGSDPADQETLVDGGGGGRPSHARASRGDRPEIGSSVGHLRIVGHLGSGGMGEVFVAEDERLRRRVALKSIRANKRMSALTRNRFLREARMLSSLDHPHICRVYDFLETPETDYLVLEYIEGEPLSHTIARRPSKAERLRISEQLAAVLVAAHAQGIVHRDLKPDNVMVTPSGDIKVLDFGLARPAVDRSQPSDDGEEGPADPARVSEARAASERHTTVGQILGTPRYMSPEQATGAEITTASDMYSFGLLLQELWTGRQPYEPTETLPELLAKVRRCQTRPVEGVEPDVTRLIEALKSSEPAYRPTAVQAHQRLRWILAKPRRRLRNAVIAAALLVSLLAGLKYTVDLRRERNEAVFRRSQADELITFMLDELHAQLQPVGQTAALAGVGERALAYLATVPERELDGDDLARRARALRTIGIVHIEQGDLERAEQALLDALEDDEALVGRDDRRADWESGRGTTHFYLGNVAYVRGDYDRALEHFETYLRSAQRLVEIEPENDDWRLEVAMGHTNVGALHEARGELDAAHEAIVPANAIKRELADRAPEDVERARSLANGLSWQATVELRRGEPRMSLGTRMQELDLRERVHGQNPRDTRGWILLTAGHNHLFDLYLLLGERDRALHHAQAMQRYARDFVQHDPLNTEWRRELGASLLATGIALEQHGRDREALLEYEQAQQIFEELVRTDGSAVDWSLQLIRALLHRAATLLRMERAAEAGALLDQATPILEARLSEAPEQRDMVVQASELHALRSRLLAREGREAEAERELSAGLDVLRPIAEGSSDPTILVQWLDLLRRAREQERTGTVSRQLESMGVVLSPLPKIS